jgi:hypothetical protein
VVICLLIANLLLAAMIYFFVQLARALRIQAPIQQTFPGAQGFAQQPIPLANYQPYYPPPVSPAQTAQKANPQPILPL